MREEKMTEQKKQEKLKIKIPDTLFGEQVEGAADRYFAEKKRQEH